MTDFQMVKTDQGRVNARIMAKEAKVDFRRVEGASLKIQTRFASAEAKRLFVRLFQTLQLNAYFVSVIARTRVEGKDIDEMERALRSDIDAVKKRLHTAIDGAEAKFKAHGIGSLATYDTPPLDIEVGVLSSSGRRYLELFNLFDQLMPLLLTLEIHEVITAQELDQERMAFKRLIKKVATTTRQRADTMRRRMHAAVQNAERVVADTGQGAAKQGVASVPLRPEHSEVPADRTLLPETAPVEPPVAE
ncbi:AcaB family transcriptional regulator [Pseudorhodoferax soli]|uniref:Uncharacterized protein DUF1845 n=1 Tax=Pseudorhodoferax soli TaxID=545864 RepID=A0A368XQW7_9BURK|nr:AcaB family transcriptional regulator [Pseudorhodoferax soli]RCW69546.1 uncharacterized protein DUF1845 [Pseudorhodoferax soli]